ncbi:hypothetical protein PG995_007418 [Apiospora arundinis]
MAAQDYPSPLFRSRLVITEDDGPLSYPARKSGRNSGLGPDLAPGGNIWHQTRGLLIGSAPHRNRILTRAAGA